MFFCLVKNNNMPSPVQGTALVRHATKGGTVIPTARLFNDIATSKPGDLFELEGKYGTTMHVWVVRVRNVLIGGVRIVDTDEYLYVVPDWYLVEEHDTAPHVKTWVEQAKQRGNAEARNTIHMALHEPDLSHTGHHRWVHRIRIAIFLVFAVGLTMPWIGPLVAGTP